MFVDGVPALRFFQQVGFRVCLAVPGDEDEIIGQEAVHVCGVIFFDCSLVLGVEGGDGFFVVIG
jgi:hypothetical protein